jgi:transketolase
MRNCFIEKLVSAAQSNPKIVLIVGDLGYSVVEKFSSLFPRRFFNAGIAEQNMTGLAAGLASEGYHVFTYSIANFPTFRCAEQIRNDIAYHKLPVTVVSVGGGVAYGPAGYSHHAVQDYALMRSFPNMLIASPGDVTETGLCMDYLIENPQPSFLRLGNAPKNDFTKPQNQLEPGVWQKITARSYKQNKKCVLSTGAALQYAQAMFDAEVVDSVYTLPLWGANHKRNQSAQLTNYEKVFTCEDHLTDGGFGSWLLEAAEKQRHKIHIKSLGSVVCGKVGSEQSLAKLGGLAQSSH